MTLATATEFTVTGSPEAMDELTSGLTRVAATASSAAERLRAVEAGAWEGQAAEAFGGIGRARDARAAEPGRGPRTTTEDLVMVLMGSDAYIGPSQPGGVEVYTSAEHVPGHVEAPEQRSFAALVAELDGSTGIILNPVSPGIVRIEGRLPAL